MCDVHDLELRVSVTYHRDSDSFFFVLSRADAEGVFDPVTIESCSMSSELSARVASPISAVLNDWLHCIPHSSNPRIATREVHPDQLSWC